MADHESLGYGDALYRLHCADEFAQCGGTTIGTAVSRRHHRILPGNSVGFVTDLPVDAGRKRTPGKTPVTMSFTRCSAESPCVQTYLHASQRHDTELWDRQCTHQRIVGRVIASPLFHTEVGHFRDLDKVRIFLANWKRLSCWNASEAYNHDVWPSCLPLEHLNDSLKQEVILLSSFCLIEWMSPDSVLDSSMIASSI
jgi:hypothetical protein